MKAQPRYQPFHDLPASQYETLKADIENHGVLIPIVVDEDGTVLDGHQRRRICAELHIDCPSVVIPGLSEEEKEAVALVLNTFRRHLVGVERSQAIYRLRSLGWSTRRIAAVTGTSKGTIHRSGAPDGAPEPPDTVTGSDGKHYPSTRPPVSSETPGPADTDTSGSGDPAESTTVDSEPEAAEPGDDETPKIGAPSPAPNPAPSGSNGSAEHSDLKYRQHFSTERLNLRKRVLTLDPERCADVIDPDDREDCEALIRDLRQWLALLEAHLSQTKTLRSV